MAISRPGKGLNQYVNIHGLTRGEEREIAVAARLAGEKNSQAFARKALWLAVENPEKVNPPTPVLPLELGGYRGYKTARRGGIEQHEPVRRELSRSAAERRRQEEEKKVAPPSFDFRGQGERNRAERALKEAGFKLESGKWVATVDGLFLEVSVYDDGTATIETTAGGKVFASTTTIEKMIERIAATKGTLQ